VVASGLSYTIVRPGPLSDAPGTGRVAAGVSVPHAEIAREDVAGTLVACLDEPGTSGVTFELMGGGEPIDEAIRALAADAGSPP
jgi:uncharacterized protein YbjT (DUF2867 family)